MKTDHDQLTKNMATFPQRINKLETRMQDAKERAEKDRQTVGQQVARLEPSTDARLKEPLTNLQKIDKKQAQLTNRLNKLEQESKKVNHLTDRTDTNTYILHPLVWMFQFPHHSAFHASLRNACNIIVEKYSEHLDQSFGSQPHDQSLADIK